MYFQRLLCFVVWYVCTGVSEELVPPSSGFLLKLHLRAYYHTAGHVSLRDSNCRKHHRESLVSYELNVSNFANTNDCFCSRHFLQHLRGRCCTRRHCGVWNQTAFNVQYLLWCAAVLLFGCLCGRPSRNCWYHFRASVFFMLLSLN